MTKFDPTTFLSNLTKRPGVYRMLDTESQVLYVGKAKNLKNRVSNYFRATGLDTKTIALVGRIADIEITITASETEALLLEQSLIKECKPPYNILFRDDKSYPFIYLSSEDKYPRLTFHRGTKSRKGRYFGPFPSSFSVRNSLSILQKVFRVRQCEDAFFKNRTRPCLQYQINRCSGPCCGLISAEAYAEDVAHAEMFLDGKSTAVINDYAKKMEAASNKLDFEQAAYCRDQISHLRKVQEQQHVVGGSGDIDVMAAVQSMGVACLLVMFIRDGRLLGNKTFFPKTRLDEDVGELLSAFIPQFYLSSRMSSNVPEEIVVNSGLSDKTILQAALSQQSGRKVVVSDSVRTQKRRWLDLAETNAEQALGGHLSNRNNLNQRFEALQEALGFDSPPERLECFDISHSAGEATVASCVVFDKNGPLKSDYRRFNIEDITPGDDYAAMRQALARRYTRIKKGEGRLPDILFVDGGKGQLAEAEKILEELQIVGVTLVGVAKGPQRKAGEERLFLSEGSELALSAGNPGLHLIQHIRDESHRFAITAHRNRRGKKRKTSILEGIEGVGPKRRRALLRHFGGTKQIQGASLQEIAKVDGISSATAEQIYTALHNG